MTSPRPPTITIDRYALYDRIGAGGMASVYLARLVGPVGFSRTVAVKRMHPHLADDPQFVAMFLDEARLATRIRHPNVVQTLDVVTAGDELLLVVEYIHGPSLRELLRAVEEKGERVPIPIAANLVAGVLHGLQAAHEATTEAGEPLGLVHRDVSPHNVLVGLDGVARVLDFGVAKASGRLHTTRSGELRGKIGYMAPEQLKRGNLTPRVDIFAAAAVLWETLAGRKLFDAEDEAELLAMVLGGAKTPPSAFNPEVTPELDAIVMRGLGDSPDARWESAEDFAVALERAVPLVTRRDVAVWVKDTIGDALDHRASRLREIETETTSKPTLEQVARLARSSGSSSLPPEEAIAGGTMAGVSARKSSARSRSAIVVGAVIVVGGAALFVRASTKSEPTATTPAVTEETRPRPSATTAAPQPSASPLPVASAAASAPSTAPAAPVASASAAPETVHPIAPRRAAPLHAPPPPSATVPDRAALWNSGRGI